MSIFSVSRETFLLYIEKRHNIKLKPPKNIELKMIYGIIKFNWSISINFLLCWKVIFWVELFL